MRAAGLIALALLAPAQALASPADPALIAFLERDGCTIGPHSGPAAQAAGLDPAAIGALGEAMLAGGTARREGDYIVLDEAVCTIRLPDITSPYTVNSPEIRAITSAIDAYADTGDRGCFLSEPVEHFIALMNGNQDAGFLAYLDFLTAGFKSGDLTFYGPSLGEIPFSVQVIAGDCADVPDIEIIRKSQGVLESGFDSYIRQVGASISCEDGGAAPNSVMIAAELQGVDPSAGEKDSPAVNAWLFFQFDMIALAAGWREGMSYTSKGKPRPPLCHYP